MCDCDFHVVVFEWLCGCLLVTCVMCNVLSACGCACSACLIVCAVCSLKWDSCVL